MSKVEFKVGDEVHWENYVDWVEGKIVRIETKIRPDEFCECCGTLLKKHGEEYKEYTIRVGKQKPIRQPWQSMIGKETICEAKDIRLTPFSGITIS